MSQSRSTAKAQTMLLQEHSQKQQENQIVSIKFLRSQKTVLSHSDELELFGKVLLFLKEFFSNPLFSKKVQSSLQKYKLTKAIDPTTQEARILSFKKMNMGSKICFEGEVTRNSSPQKDKQEQQRKDSVGRGKYKKISIFMMEEDYSDSSDQPSSDSIFSWSSLKTIRSIELPQMDMSIQTIALIYEQPQPFLINLSLCLMMRYCLASRREVCFEDSAWVLSVATIVAYKIYYDEQIEGLMDCFMGIMKVTRKDLIDLQRCFLEEINYNTVIHSHDYHFILSNLISFAPKEHQQ